MHGRSPRLRSWEPTGQCGSSTGIGSRRQEDPQAEYEACKKAYEEQFSNPFLAAEKGYVDEIILPEETVPRLRETFRLLRTKQVDKVSVRRHGNMPL